MSNFLDIVWTPVSFTHVEYEKGDQFGKFLAWTSLFPFVVLSGFLTHIYFRREIHTIVFFIGIFLNEMVNYIVKHIVQEPRPDSGHTTLNVKHGWPSSHSQFSWFFFTYLILFIYIRSHNNNTTLDLMWKHCMSALCVIAGCVVSYSRVYLLYHTVNQIVWGCIFGTMLGLSWFAVAQILLTPFFPFVVTWRVCEFFMIRDSTLIPNIMWFEYTTSRQESRSRSRKMSSNKLQ
nr:dolichyldiphosphatase 1-like [Ciona intestinalis]|eukprot:XP_002131668.3 dolichyldiphosphatase 1-like [Ciona intestinalis]